MTEGEELEVMPARIAAQSAAGGDEYFAAHLFANLLVRGYQMPHTECADHLSDSVGPAERESLTRLTFPAQ